MVTLESKLMCSSYWRLLAPPSYVLSPYTCLSDTNSCCFNALWSLSFQGKLPFQLITTITWICPTAPLTLRKWRTNCLMELLRRAYDHSNNSVLIIQFPLLFINISQTALCVACPHSILAAFRDTQLYFYCNCSDCFLKVRGTQVWQ